MFFNGGTTMKQRVIPDGGEPDVFIQVTPAFALRRLCMSVVDIFVAMRSKSCRGSLFSLIRGENLKILYNKTSQLRKSALTRAKFRWFMNYRTSPW